MENVQEAAHSSVKDINSFRVMRLERLKVWVHIIADTKYLLKNTDLFILNTQTSHIIIDQNHRNSEVADTKNSMIPLDLL